MKLIDKETIMSLYKEKLHLIAEKEYQKNQTILIGDCLIENLDIEKHFPNLEIYNNGISGDTTELLYKTLNKRALKYRPNKLFISIGSNDLGFEKKGVKEIYQNIISIVLEVKKRSKNTEIYLISVVPVNPANMDCINREYVDSRDNFEINLLNNYLKNYAYKNRLKFVDITKHLKNDFYQLNLDYTSDGFHLNEIGYKVVSEQIKLYV